MNEPLLHQTNQSFQNKVHCSYRPFKTTSVDQSAATNDIMNTVCERETECGGYIVSFPLTLKASSLTDSLYGSLRVALHRNALRFIPPVPFWGIVFAWDALSLAHRRMIIALGFVAKTPSRTWRRDVI